MLSIQLQQSRALWPTLRPAWPTTHYVTLLYYNTRSLGTTGPDQFWGPPSFLFDGHQQTRTQNFLLGGRWRGRRGGGILKIHRRQPKFLCFKIPVYQSPTDFVGWYPLKGKSRKKFYIIVSPKSVFFLFRFVCGLQPCNSPPLGGSGQRD